jgi:DNA-binding NtrC family response regulator
MSNLLDVLVISADSKQAQILATILGHWGLSPVCSSSRRQAQEIVERGAIRMVFCEERFADGCLCDVVAEFGKLSPKVPVIAFSEAGDWKWRMQAIQSGAAACITVPFRSQEIREVITTALTGATGGWTDRESL